MDKSATYSINYSTIPIKMGTTLDRVFKYHESEDLTKQQLLPNPQLISDFGPQGDNVIVFSTYNWESCLKYTEERPKIPSLIFYDLNGQRELGQILGGIAYLSHDQKSNKVVYLTHQQWITGDFDNQKS